MQDNSGVRSVVPILECIGIYLCSFFVMIMTGGIWAYNRMTDLTLWDEYDTFLVILFVTLVVLFFSKGKIRLQDSHIERIVFALTCISLYLVNMDEGYCKTKYKQYFFIPLIMTLLLFVLIDNKERIWRAFTNVVCVFAAVSLFFYTFGTWFHIISPMNHIIREWGNWGPNPIPNYYYLYYQAQVTHHGDFDLWRNCGIFAEAPMYNMVLCTALASEVFLYKRLHGRRLIVILLTITIITTFSTTGFLFLLLLFALYILNSSILLNFVIKHKKIAIVVTALLCVMGIIILTLKFQTPQGTGSAAVRLDHTVTCFKIWKDYFLFGDGWNNTAIFMELAEHPQGLSVGLPHYLAGGGIVLGSLIFVPYVMCIIASIKNHNYAVFSFSSLFIMLFFLTAIIIYPILVLFIAYIIFCCDAKVSR